MVDECLLLRLLINQWLFVWWMNGELMCGCRVDNKLIIVVVILSRFNFEDQATTGFPQR